jgi:hypothetical protein
MKKLYFLLFFLLMSAFSFGQGSESFTNSNATSSYADNSFVGDGGVTWTYIHSRNANADANTSGITLPALMLRRLSSGSKITSSVVSGGVGDFSVKLYKGFTGANDRQVELYVNDVLAGTSVAFDDFAEHTFTVTGVDVGGDVIIELRTITEGQIIIDDMSWTTFAGAGSPGLVVNSPSDGAIIATGTTNVNFSITAQNFNVANGTGDGHIHWTLDSGSGPIDQGEKYDTADEPIAVTDGQTYTVYMDFVDNSEAVLDPAINQTVSFYVNNPPRFLPFSEDFSYTDGSLVPNGQWASIGGTAGNLLVSSGQAVVNHNNDEDVSLEFLSVAGDVYYALDFSVDDLGAPYVGTDNEYFAHMDFKARLDIVPGTSGGDFSVGIASNTGNTEAFWATDLTFGQTYRAVVKYDQLSGLAQLWIDAALSTDTSISGTAAGAATVSSIDLRQAVSSENETIRVDNIDVGTTFASMALGTNNFETKNFSIYPNPTNTGSVNIVSSNTSNYGKINVAVYDVLGKQIINKVMTSEKLNVSTLNTGVYIIKITQGKAISTKKLVIN